MPNLNGIFYTKKFESKYWGFINEFEKTNVPSGIHPIREANNNPSNIE